jgi:8-oxo-dGTP pyrophosphatase MutT (NUDIX family)
VSNLWKPAVTVAAVAERNGRFLLVEEETPDGIRLNQPAGHLEPGESLVQAVVREAREETACRFTPTHLLGVYLWRAHNGVTYTRFAFAGAAGRADPALDLDRGILRALWLTPAELAVRAAAHRSPLVMRCVDDYLRGQRFALDALYTHPSALAAA